ncbi:hypothetical protein KP509_17G053300 [Ceratopteris richardii]|uniref:Tyrosinase copper-binding domain-containing protein n=1 Tax=Ceratopteris richardii TaxID=49495 RepID=A0A8T2SWZ4_CERRI|nr:hypothetical protein KP509_17G053300 [Ceratopteris richardii]
MDTYSTRSFWLFGLLFSVSAAVLMSSVRLTTGSPIGVPNLQECQLATDTSVVGPLTTIQLNCCLPIPSGSVVEFSFDKYKSDTKRIRMPAQNVSADYIAKYRRAYELMRSLPQDDPRSLATQANIHCSFCNGAYKQAGNDSVLLQVHFSWVFLPWHRWYLYFHERILASLLGDPTFSLVFWNWDDQRDGGNVMPAMYLPNDSSLYDAKRNQANLPPTLVKLVPTITGNDSEIINQNLNAMYQDVVTNDNAELFMGGAYVTGTDLSNSTVLSAPLGGSIENGIHNAMHFWTGDPTQPLIQDMGTFTTASRDPIFYAHHSNVDRLWDKWRYGLPGGPRADHSEDDFLNTEFYFYDENASLVKVNVRDALDSSKLGYSYPDVAADELWINYSPSPVTSGSAVQAALASGVPVVGPYPQNGTISLGSGLTAIVAAPGNQSKSSDEREVLVIQRLTVTRDIFVAVLVFVNLPSAHSSTVTSSAEYVGTYNIIAAPGKTLTANVKMEIGDNLQRIGIQNETEVVLTLAVKGTQPITIDGLLIHYE